MFKVGDIICGFKNNKKVFSNQNMTRAEVVSVTDYDYSFKILEHIDDTPVGRILTSDFLNSDGICPHLLVEEVEEMKPIDDAEFMKLFERV